MANINLTDSSNIKVVQSGGDISLDFKTSGEIGDLSLLTTSNKSSLVSAINEVNSLKFAYGQELFSSVGSNSYKDVVISFASAGFTSTPNIVFGVEGNSTGGANGSTLPAVVRSTLTTTSCTIRYYNASSSSITNYVNWIAIGT